MRKYEIYVSDALEENLEEKFTAYDIKEYSKLSPVAGRGFSTPMLNNDVWPGRNSLYIVYTENDDAIIASLKELREQFPNEGIAAFTSVATAM